MRLPAYRRLRAFSIAAVAALALPLATVGTSSAHADDGLGDFTFVDCQAPDGGTGTIDSPINDLDLVNETVFEPGDHILFVAGTTCDGTLRPQGSGEAGAPIVVDTFGEGEKAKINGGGIDAVVQLWNQEYWEIRNLDISNIDPDENDHYEQERRGVVIALEDYGQGDYYRLEGLEIHDVYGEGKKDLGGSGGIQLEVYASDNPSEREPTWFNDVTIENNVVENVNRSGINMSTAWKCRIEQGWDGCPPEDRAALPWTPSTGLVIRNNTVTNVGGDGIVVQMNTGALVEHNTVSDVANRPNGSNAAVWAWNADYTLFQYNEVFDTKRLPDNNDGNSFDADYGTTGTVFQYNYSHDNEGGMMLYCGCGGLATDITFRYNISENDGDRVQFVAGATEAAFYNNTIIAPAEANFRLNNVNSNGTSLLMANNLFIATEDVVDESAIDPDRNFIPWRNNAFAGDVNGWPQGDHVEDSVFIGSGLSTGDGDDLERFKLRHEELAGAGIPLAEPGTVDFFGNPVPSNCAPDIGAFQFSAAADDCGIAGTTIPADESITDVPVAPLSTYEVTSASGSVSVKNPNGFVTEPNEHGAAIFVATYDATTVDLLCAEGEECAEVNLAPVANSAIDPSYEARSNTPWGVWNSARTTDSVVSGDRAAVLNGAGSTEQRVINLQQNTDYVLHGWLSTSDDEAVRLGFKNFDGNEDPDNPNHQQEYEEVDSDELSQASLTFNTGDSTWINIYCYRPAPGGTANCDDITLTALDPAPVVAQQPVNTTVREGQLAYFAARFAGIDRSNVSWERNDGDGWVAAEDGLGNKLTTGPVTAADDGSQFRAVVAGPSGIVVTEPASLTVLDAIAAPEVTKEPKDATVVPGTSVDFTAAAKGTPAPEIQWQTSIDGTTWDDVDGASTSELTLTDVAADEDGLQVRARFTSALGHATSSAATLNVETTGDGEDETDEDDEPGDGDNGDGTGSGEDGTGSGGDSSTGTGSDDAGSDDDESDSSGSDGAAGGSDGLEDLPSTGATIGRAALVLAVVLVLAGTLVLGRRRNSSN